MSLQFIFGNSGSGKSAYLYKKVLDEAKQNPDKNYLILVPEQFTMQTQRELVQLQEAHAIMNVDVLSFARLAYRVFDELGKENLMVLEETGKNLVLRKIAEEKKEELQVLGGNMNKMGYVGEVKSLISEFAQYNVTPKELEAFLHRAQLSETLRRKLEDVLVLYQGFRSFLEGKFITSEEVLSLLCEVADESAIIRKSVIAFDEFTGFTPVQNKLIERLLQVAEKLMVSVTIDNREDFYHCRGTHELFAMSKKTIKSLLDMAGKLHVEVREPVVLESGIRYQNAKELHFMEQNLFRIRGKSWQEEIDVIRMSVHKNPKEELRYVASKIAGLVRNDGYRYKDIAVVTGDVNLYANYVPELFDKYEIPFFIDQTKNILYHPLVEFVRAVLEVMESGFSYESMFRFLRCGLCGIEENQIDLLENYVLAKNIRGYSKWQKNWTVSEETTSEELEDLNKIRIQIVTMLEPVLKVFGKKKIQIREATIALYELLDYLKIERQMKEKEVAYTESGDFAKAKEYGQIYKILMDLLDKVVSLLGEEEVSVKEYADILDAGFDAAKVAVIPPGNDKVTIGDIERTRLQHIRILFFVGVNDGVVPKAESAGGIISQYERERLSELDLELAPGARERVFIQKFYLYLNMTKPSDRLYLTMAKVNAEGKALRKSYLTGTIQKLFPKLVIEEEPQPDTFLTPQSAMEYFIKGLENTENAEMWNALAQWYLTDETFANEVHTLLDANYMVYTDEPISHAVTKALYGTTLENSVTRLERFAACAFAHYLQYGLGLKEREISEFAGVDMGNLYHGALERFAKQIESSKYTWFDVPKDVADNYAQKAMEDTIAGFQMTTAFENARNRYLLSRMKQTMHCTVWALLEQVKKGKFIPSDFEVSFSGTSDFNAIRFQLSKEEKMQLCGRIDRVDTCEAGDKIYVRIIDYKSGNTSFSLLNLYHGLQLQLVVYMNAALELVEKKHPGKTAEPAGIFYYHVKHPMVDGLGYESEEEIRAAVFEQLKLNGVVNEKQEIYRAMDTDFSGNSSIIPVGEKADGSLKATSKVLSTKDFEQIFSYVNKKITETGKQIFAGDVSINPYQQGTASGCDYCPYHTVCGFDTRIPGYHYRKLENFDDSAAVLEKIKEGAD